MNFLIFAGKSCGIFGGNFAGFFRTHKNEGSQFLRENSEHFFVRKFVTQTKIIWANFALQMCHLNPCFRGVRGNVRLIPQSQVRIADFEDPTDRLDVVGDQD